MSERLNPLDLPDSHEPIYRCPHCDSVVTMDAVRCLMCGRPLTAAELVVEGSPVATAVVPAPPLPPPGAIKPVGADGAETVVFESMLRERQSPVVLLLTAVFALIILVLGGLILRYQQPVAAFSFVATAPPIPPTPTYTPVWTPLPTETLPPSPTPTITLTPAPTDTPPPPRLHAIASGETLIGLSLRYRIAAESIALANGLTFDSSIQVGQNLAIPWPTPTPHVPYIPLEINGEVVLAVTENCAIYEVQPDDTASGIAASHDIPLAALLAVNWQTEESVQLLQPDDRLCIPQIEYNLSVLPPTPGPSPTPGPTAVPAGPELLYPVANTVVEALEATIALQWVAVKDLADNEWYMVELKDMADLDGLPHRGFTRDTLLHVPGSWRPVIPEMRRMRWRVSIVQVNGRRADGGFIYIFGGNYSEDAFFSWQGAIPTPTPTPTPSATPTAAP